jgi:carboxyl-terminal processing protease
MKTPGQRKRWFSGFAVILLCGLSFAAGGWMQARAGNPEDQLLRAAYRQIKNESLYNQQSSQELAYAAVRGMLGAIDDPYAELIEPEAAQNFEEAFTGKTGVIGLYAENKGGQVVTSIVFPGGAADQAGLQPGDVILAIDDHKLDTASDSSEAGLRMRGLPGQPVRLKILRGSQELEFDLVRKEREFVTARLLSSGIGYISLTAYNRTASQQMRQSLAGLLELEPAGLIWDLRNNEGGDMQAAQETLSFFIDQGLLFSATLTHDRTVQFRAKGGALAPDLPLVVLIDGTSYSAAETCAAAIAETGRGKTIGSTTYGKGVIQATIPLADHTLLQMTVAKWLSPMGEWYDGRGVPPQVEFFDDPTTKTDELLQKAVEILGADQ